MCQQSFLIHICICLPAKTLLFAASVDYWMPFSAAAAAATVGGVRKDHRDDDDVQDDDDGGKVGLKKMIIAEF
jgi:hypothetical protein